MSCSPSARRHVVAGLLLSMAATVAVVVTSADEPAATRARAAAPTAVAPPSPSPSVLSAIEAPRGWAVAAEADHAGHDDHLGRHTAAGLACDRLADGAPLCTHGDSHGVRDHGRSERIAASTGGRTGTTGAIGCYGDGQDGARVRLVYAKAEGSPDRFEQSLPSFTGWAKGASGQLDASAKATGGRRHVRYATTPGSGCQLVVQRVTLPTKAFSTYKAMVQALVDRGLDQSDSKYLVWTDADVYCGLGTLALDDRPGTENDNNGAITGYARIDRDCWGQAETHELLHMLGGVQPGAPNATEGFHCSDGSDVMCYDDRTKGSTQRRVCPDGQLVLDCGHDDYFSTAAPAGSYLQTHWNTARSRFLAPLLTDAPPARSASSPTPPSPARSPSSSPRPLVPALDLPELPDLIPNTAVTAPAPPGRPIGVVLPRGGP